MEGYERRCKSEYTAGMMNQQTPTSQYESGDEECIDD